MGAKKAMIRHRTHVLSTTKAAAFLFLLLLQEIRPGNCFISSLNIQKDAGIQDKHNLPTIYPERYLAEQTSNQKQDSSRQNVARRSMIIGAFVATTGALVACTTNEATAMEIYKSSTTNSIASASTAAATIDWTEIVAKAGKKAVGGGKAGASASVVQVFSLMWLRTTMNYQYRYGGSLPNALSTLWSEGGIPRFYQGLPFALIQGPLTRFGDTAANVGIFALLESLPETKDLPLPVKTACGSIAAGLWRIFLMPVDASKTLMQVEGAEGLKRLWGSVRENGPSPLYRGAVAQAAATTAGHFPWFLTFNFLNEHLPVISSSDDLLLALARSAFVGMSASCVSDCISNSLRVIKTTKQTAQLGVDATGQKELSYPEVIQMILEDDGVVGLFGRGLQTRLLTNAIQGAAFSVLWKYFQEAG